jgi:hypothetical protein
LNLGNSINIKYYYSLINEYHINEILTYGLTDENIEKTENILGCRLEKINDNILLYSSVFNLIIFNDLQIDLHELYLKLHVSFEILKKSGIIMINNINSINKNTVEKFFTKYKDKLNYIYFNNSNIIFEKI